MTRTLWLDPRDGSVRTLDQTRLPFERRELVLPDSRACEDAIRGMQVRGAPLIGAVAAFGLALALREQADDAALQEAVERLRATRPTAVNLAWALTRIRQAVAPLPAARRAQVAWSLACDLADEDVACNRSIGHFGAGVLAPLGRAAQALRVLTHCNAGRLATVGEGTALAPVRALQRSGRDVWVWVDETRPRGQGAALTAWELAEDGIAHALIADNAAGLLMQRGEVDAVIVGCDRVAANGDVANKVGTYLKALAAFDNGIPFYVACPVSTIDAACPSGDAIPIEERSPREVTHQWGQTAQGEVLEVRIAPPGCQAANPAFDLTPARLITGLITEHGVFAASVSGVAEAVRIASLCK